ncbi:extracellular solute-binding protein family 1 [Clostridium sp. CAG:448]|nr:extracellular solute-binding protein family 1 [Clostridium sp. CAG:448]
MKKTKFQRFAACLLALTMLLGSALVSVSAATGTSDASSGSSVTDKSLQEIRELLNAISYSEYVLSDVFTTTGYAKEQIVIDVLADIDTSRDGNCYIDDEKVKELTAGGNADKVNDYAHKSTLYRDADGNEIESLYTPSNGSVSWKVELSESAKYAIVIEYYAVTGKATAVERVFKINDKVPFSEARYLTLNKNWVTEPVQYQLRDGETAESAKADLESIGLTVTKDESGNLYCAIPEVWDEELVKACEDRGLRFFLTDVTNNEIRSAAVQAPVWTNYYLRDSSGYYTDNFVFALEKGTNILTLEGKNEPLAIKSIRLVPVEETPTYDEYIKNLGSVKNNANSTVRLEAEYPNATSSKTIYPTEDRSDAANSPSDVSRTVMNTLGGEKWQTAGQYVEYNFRVSGSGMYDLISHFRQNILDGMYVCRSLEIYSHNVEEGTAGYYNGAPFEEAKSLRYNYSANWNVTKLTDGSTGSDGKTRNYPIYFVGTDDNKDAYYTIRFVVTLGSMGDIVREVQEILNSVNNDYLNILRLTGANPNTYNSYGFSRVMPDTLIDMIVQSRRLDNSENKNNKNYQPGLAERLTTLAGQKSSNVGTLQRIADLLKKMGTDEEEIPTNLENLKTYIGTLGTFLSDAQTQPLLLDYILIRPADSAEKMPRGKAGFFQAIAHEVSGFFMSFVRDYNSMGSMDEDADKSIEVWLAYGRDQSQVIRNLINNDFTPNTGVAVDLKLVAAATLLPSILSGSGPDVYLGLGQADVINYAIRSALINIDDRADFAEVRDNFNDAAMLVLGIEDADQIMHYYGLPETQSFTMMFVRDDVLADLGLEVPKTWDDILAAVPVLQSQKMEIGLTTDFQIFLYQRNGELFADNGMRINLDSVVGLSSFEYMCNLFTQYSFPYTYNAANRFRTGEMPIIIGDYTAMYNQLKVFATEIEGAWEFLPMPGIKQEDGSINNVSISSIAAVVMVSGVEDKDSAWEYMKWYTGKDCQSDYTNEMVAILGPSAKHPTANKYALEDLPWTTSELAQVQAQFNNLAAVPNYPGAYIIGRYTNFAFLSAYNDKADPAESILSYVPTINKEITRKRNEFKLETLEAGETLASKRLNQATGLLDKIEKNSDYKSDYAEVIREAKAAIKDQNENGLMMAAEKLRGILRELDPNYQYVESHANDGNTNYKNSTYWKNLESLMGYDMNDLSLTNKEKKKLRKCYYYEAYDLTDEMATLLHFAAEYMEDAAAALSTY